MNNNTKRAIEVFRSGGIVIFPTDTAYGIGCKIDNEEALQKIYEIRHRPSAKPLLILVSSEKMAEEYILPVNREVKSLMRKYWPGGVTFVLPANKEKVSSIVRANKDTVALRLPKHKELVEIIDEVGVPIVAPSANFSGEATPLTIEQVDENLKKQVDFILPGVCTIKGVSTILDVTKQPFEIVRQGVVTISDEDTLS